MLTTTSEAANIARNAVYDSLKAAVLFPGRRTLKVNEIAEVPAVSPQHILDLIEEARLEALDMSGDPRGGRQRHWRVPVDSYDKLIEQRRGDK